MIELVIDAPHLQTPGQRLSTALLSLSGWLLWGYCLLPLLILCGGWLGIHICAFWVNLCGGYAGLLKLMFLYVATITGSACGWAAWIGYDRWRQSSRAGHRPAALPVSSSAMSAYFNQPEPLLDTCRNCSIVTVEFDGEGRITGLIPHPLDQSAQAVT